MPADRGVYRKVQGGRRGFLVGFSQWRKSSMSLFAYYIMVDWSGGNSRSSNRPNCIWIAHGSANASAPTTESPPSRTEAIKRVEQLLRQFYKENQVGRALACFDFGFAFPRGLASHLSIPNPNCQLWQRVWNYLETHMEDDIGTRVGRRPSNRSNRFEVADNLNLLICQDIAGPFWCVDPNWRNHRVAAGLQVSIPQNQPQGFVSNAGVQIPVRRIVDEVIQSDFPFRLFGNGSVGSQMLTGIPRLQQLRQSQELGQYGQIKVWPFETGWATPVAGGWLENDVRLLLAEIYPSVMPALDDQIVDRGQVRAMWHWARDLDNEDELRARFERPNELNDEQDVTVRSEEGWVLH